jgi:hypothetical protein
MSIRRGGGREDYVLRIIRQAAEALRMLRLRLSGGTESPELVRRQAASAVEGLLGADAPLLARLDAVSAARLVGDARRVALWGGLLDVQAGAHEAQGDAAAAAALRARARALAAARADRWPDDPAHDTAEGDAAGDGAPDGERPATGAA